MKRLVFAAPIAALLFTGFGCRMQPVANTNTVAYEDQRAAEWIEEGPMFAYTRDADISTGRVVLTLRTRPAAEVVVTLTGPNTIEKATQRTEADADGRVRFAWNVNRLGEYAYSGQILVAGGVMARFEDVGYAR